MEEKRAEEWYEERVAGALTSYWIYQHLSNLAPAELRETSLLTEVREAGDARELLRGFAVRADREAGHSRWSFSRRLGSCDWWSWTPAYTAAAGGPEPPPARDRCRGGQ